MLPVLPVTPLIAPNTSLSTKPQAFPVLGYAVAEDPGHKCSLSGLRNRVGGGPAGGGGIGGFGKPLGLLFE